MNDDRGNDGFLIVGAFLVALLFLGAAFAGYVVLRQRSSRQVVATATATVTPVAMPPLTPPVGCVTPPIATTAIPTVTATPSATAPWAGPSTMTSPKPPSLRMGATTVTGRLPPEVIQRIVRQNFGRFRLCYETGLKSDPALEGKVAVRFVIDADGGVSSAAQDPSTTLADKTVVSCVVRAFSTMSFPKPEGGGIVTVVYPITFNPGA